MMSPAAPARVRAGVRGEAAWKHFNLLSESNSLVAAEDRTSFTTWKELLCSKTHALDANLRCLMSGQGRVWAPLVRGMSAWTIGELLAAVGVAFPMALCFPS